MTNEQILKKAIEKAEENIIDSYKDGVVVAVLDREHPEIKRWENSESVNTIIFSHDFAEAFWKELTRKMPDTEGEIVPAWKSHLQQMVLEEDKLKYIEKYL